MAITTPTPKSETEKDVNLAEARQNLPELADRAYAGQVFRIARRGRPLAVLIGVDEYERLRQLEQEEIERNWEILLAPPNEGDPPDELTEEEAIELVLSEIRAYRAEQRTEQQKQQPK